MANRPKVMPSVKLNIALPLDSWTLLTSHLYSQAEGRVPKSAYQKFFIERINEYFKGANTNAPTNT